MGLGREYWHDVIKVLREIIPIYDKVNHAISLGRIRVLREMGIKLLIDGYSNDKILVLDAGSGYGNMSEILQDVKDDTEIVMLDPIPEMLMVAMNRFNNMMVSAVFESLPFSDNTFDLIMCGYSFRDAMSYARAIEEFARVLKDDGRLVIVDLGKPNNIFYRATVTFYLAIIMPLIAFIIAGRKGLKFKEIYGTYKRLPKNRDMASLLKTRFKEVRVYEMLFGGAVIFLSFK